MEVFTCHFIEMSLKERLRCLRRQIAVGGTLTLPSPTRYPGLDLPRLKASLGQTAPVTPVRSTDDAKPSDTSPKTHL